MAPVKEAILQTQEVLEQLMDSEHYAAFSKTRTFSRLGSEYQNKLEGLITHQRDPRIIDERIKKINGNYLTDVLTHFLSYIDGHNDSMGIILARHPQMYEKEEEE